MCFYWFVWLSVFSCWFSFFSELFSLAIFVTATILSSGDSLMSLDPWVFLPIMDVPLVFTLIMIPFLLMSIISSSFVTDDIATTLPFLSVVWMFITPYAPLLVSL